MRLWTAAYYGGEAILFEAESDRVQEGDLAVLRPVRRYIRHDEDWLDGALDIQQWMECCDNQLSVKARWWADISTAIKAWEADQQKRIASQRAQLEELGRYANQKEHPPQGAGTNA